MILGTMQTETNSGARCLPIDGLDFKVCDSTSANETGWWCNWIALVPSWKFGTCWSRPINLARVCEYVGRRPALDAMARACGYLDFADACDVYETYGMSLPLPSHPRPDVPGKPGARGFGRYDGSPLLYLWGRDGGVFLVSQSG